MRQLVNVISGLTLVSALSLVGCANTSKEAAGTGVGAVTGAAIGYGVGGGAVGTIGGAAVGAVVGNVVGKSMDEEDKKNESK
jgi:osmotically inducible lipoprotein OsmB